MPKSQKTHPLLSFSENDAPGGVRRPLYPVQGADGTVLIVAPALDLAELAA